jgi:shikimate 5-dehydrogenase/shikimate kinase
MAAHIAGAKRSFALMEGDTPSSIMGRSRNQPVASPSPSSGSHSGSNRDRLQPSVPNPDYRSSQASTPNPRIDVRSFNRDASILLVGARGTGKSTLGVIAATAFRRRLIDTNHAFEAATGHSASAFREIHGALDYHKKELEVLEAVLSNNSTKSIIVCGRVSLTRDGRAHIERYARNHPVVLILRDVKSAQIYLKAPQIEKVAELFAMTEKMFRTCSNLEFFNSSDTATVPALPNPSLALKKAERHFVKFLTLATNISNAPSLEDAYPLSRVCVEERSYTYAVSVPLTRILSTGLDIERIEEGADVFEVRIDATGTFCCLQPQSLTLAAELETSSAGKQRTSRFAEVSEALALIRRITAIPFSYHVEMSALSRRVDTVASKQLYLDLVYHGLRLAPEFATVDLCLTDEEIRDIIAVKGSTKLMAQSKSANRKLMNWEHPHWQSEYERAKRLGFDIVRLVWPATCVEDNFAAQRFREKIRSRPGSTIPLVAYNMGTLGRTSRCFNPILTPITHEDLPNYKQLEEAPSITARDCTKALYSSFVFEPMRFYIMGASTSYSLSPVMHKAAYQLYGMPHEYEIYQSTTLSELKTVVNDPHFGGCSISIPFKLEVIALTHSISRHAKAIGAINTILPVRHLTEDGNIPDDLALFKERNRSGPVKALYGENTDWIGIRACVKRGLSPANAISPTTTALVIGSGGMARAAVYALLHLGLRNIFIYNRTKENAEKLVEHFRRILEDKSLGWSEPANVNFTCLVSLDQPWQDSQRPITIVVSCIPTHSIGDSPSPNFTLHPTWLSSPTGGVVMEVGYRNIRTPLLEQCRAKAADGWVTLDGLDMLPEQGFAQFELFTGRRAPRRVMRAEVLKGYRDEQGRPDPEHISWRLDQIKEQEP